MLRVDWDCPRGWKGWEARSGRGRGRGWVGRLAAGAKAEDVERAACPALLGSRGKPKSRGRADVVAAWEEGAGGCRAVFRWRKGGRMVAGRGGGGTLAWFAMGVAAGARAAAALLAGPYQITQQCSDQHAMKASRGAKFGCSPRQHHCTCE